MAFNGDEDYDLQAFPPFGIILFAISVVILTLLLFIVCVTAKSICANRRRPERSTRRVVDPEDDQTERLEESVVESFPVFVYQCKNYKEKGLECAVCLCEFEENEKGKMLPLCKHSFHADCISMWFDSHSTCPLCRAGAQADPPSQTAHAQIVP